MKTGINILLILALEIFSCTSAYATDQYRLNVSYSSGSVKYGPLSFGLAALPETVEAVFTLDAGQHSIDGNSVVFNESNVISALVVFGDAIWTEKQLKNIYMTTSRGTVSSLSYAFLPTEYSKKAPGGIVLNFPLSVTGIDLASNEKFNYEYSESSQQLSIISQPKNITIDIKPDSSPNCFNVNGHGVIPVAILGSMDFDVSRISLDSLSFSGLALRMRGNKGPQCSLEYSNHDEYADLVCQFEDDTANWSAGTTEARLTGLLSDGDKFEGKDSFCVVR
ncbi:MAG: hypothetical protein OEY36_04715 [Gammaproteobacteria bacterium]|nr:hypothetical protein [Gammaproteobacteria bacterium]